MAEPSLSNFISGLVLDNDTSLGGDVVNLKSFVLASNIDNLVTTIPVTATISGINTPVYLLIDSELIYAEGSSGTNFTSCVRGANGTTAASHTSGALITAVCAANSFNQLKRAIIATQTALRNQPDGTMLNGKISPTVSANDLIVTLLTTDSSTPSATNPVLVKINGTWRTITAATSITIPDGTNYFNSGSAELGTLLVGYFPYLIYDSNSSIVALSISRIPYGRLVSDFSATTTNEKHLFNYANFTSTDDVVNIGYSEATLSLAGTSHLWTVPTCTNANLINHPVFETRWLTYTPTTTIITEGDGTKSGRYRIKNTELRVYSSFVFGSTSAMGSGAPTFSLPFTLLADPASVGYHHDGALLDSGTTRHPSFLQVTTATVTVFAVDTSGAYAVRANLSSTIPFTWATGDTIYQIIEGPLV